MRHRLFVGWDARQMVACNIAVQSAQRKAALWPDVRQIYLQSLQSKGLYTRPTLLPETISDNYYDVISEAPMSTGHAIARFLVPALCDFSGWAVFTDGDVLFRRDLADLFALADETKAVQVVQHNHIPTDATKMDGQAQTVYARKNWSSVILWNCSHPAHLALPDLVNRVPGRHLHRFCWLTDDLVGALPPEWNVLIGEETHPDPAIVHFTLGVPNMPGYEHQPYADEWYAMARKAGYKLKQPDPVCA